MFERIDKILTKFEKKGYNIANKLHIWTINFILCGLAYGTYTFFRDYNNFFLDARRPDDNSNILPIENSLDYPINRSINERK